MKNKNELVIVLVVVGIVILLVPGILAGMLLPALNQAKEKARQADCTSKLSQVGKAFFQYAMSYDDWYPTVRKYQTRRGVNGFYTFEFPVDGGKWIGADSYKAFQLLRDSDLLTDPKGYVCPSKDIKAASFGDSLSGHVSYQWSDGVVGSNTLSPVCADGVDNHNNTGRFTRGDGSVGYASAPSKDMKWYQDASIKDFCTERGNGPNNLPDYSF